MPKHIGQSVVAVAVDEFFVIRPDEVKNGEKVKGEGELERKSEFYGLQR